MSESESFIARWSRRKRQAAERADAPESGDSEAAATSSLDRHPPLEPASCPPAPAGEETKGDVDAWAKPASDDRASESTFDPASLPPIETITAETDIRAFLAAGVPPELTRAALRRAWTVDPKVRDFVGLAENAWDFTAPDAIPGFGSLELTDEMRRNLTEMVSRSLRAPASQMPSDGAVPNAATGNETAASTAAPRRQVQPEVEPPRKQAEEHGDTTSLPAKEQQSAPQQHRDAGTAEPIRRRARGRALPE